jgi:RNA 3'-terminal phosphate cyclase (ATP)
LIRADPPVRRFAETSLDPLDIAFRDASLEQVQHGPAQPGPGLGVGGVDALHRHQLIGDLHRRHRVFGEPEHVKHCTCALAATEPGTAPLALAGAPSAVVIEGGTHNSGAPPFDFLDRSFFPLLRRIGYVVEARMKRPGFYPAGGGIIEVTIGVPGPFKPLVLEDRGAELSYNAEAVIANLPADIAKRELAALGSLLGWPEDGRFIRSQNEAAGPGNCLMLTMAYEHVCEVVTAFGRIGASSEAVAAEAANEARAYLAGAAPVGPHLADQLILPMALAAGGRYLTGPLSAHTRTNIATVSRFIERPILLSDGSGESCMVEI